MMVIAERGGNDAHLLLLDKLYKLKEEYASLEAEIARITAKEKGDKGEMGSRGFPGTDGKDGKDGRDGRDGKDGRDGLDGESIIGPVGVSGRDGSPDTPEQIANKLSTLKEVVDGKFIKGWNEIREGVQRAASRTVGMAARAFTLYTDGTKRHFNINSLNIAAGAGVSIDYNYASGRNDVTISASASSSVLEATGARDDSNTEFTFVSEPAIIVVNGASYRSTGGAITWSWDSGTLTATLSSAPGTGGDVYGVA